MATETLTTYGRRAYGAHRLMTPDVKARNVAASITQRLDEGREWTWSDYGLDGNHEQQQRVLKVLAALR